MVGIRGKVGIGVDSCRAGRFWISLGGARPEFGIAFGFEDILNLDPRNVRIVVDIPIGLPAGRLPARWWDLRLGRLMSRVRKVGESR